MSKGISKKQQAIVGILSGKRRGMVYANAKGGLQTSEILEELIELELVNPDAPRKQQMGSTMRACRSLNDRGLIKGVWASDPDNAGRMTVSWSIATEEVPS